jgi:hypothetical protein
MFRSVAICFLLIVFVLQTLFFNLFLAGIVFVNKTRTFRVWKPHAAARMHEEDFRNLKWLNNEEALIGSFLCDVNDIRKQGNYVSFTFKVDQVEKTVLKKLKEYFKHMRHKKNTAFIPLFTFHECSVALPPAQQEPVLHFSGYEIYLLTPSGEPASPPPEVGFTS